MPVPKAVRRAARAGGNVGAKATISAPTQQTDGLFILEVKSSKLKETSKGPYRSVTGLAADGKLYWAPLDPSFKPEPGQKITLRGMFKGTFGGQDGKPEYHKILGPKYFPEVVSIADKSPEMSAPLRKALKFGSADAEALPKELETLVKQHGIGKILSVLGEIT